MELQGSWCRGKVATLGCNFCVLTSRLRELRQVPSSVGLGLLICKTGALSSRVAVMLCGDNLGCARQHYMFSER